MLNDLDVLRKIKTFGSSSTAERGQAKAKNTKNTSTTSATISALKAWKWHNQTIATLLDLPNLELLSKFVFVHFPFV